MGDEKMAVAGGALFERCQHPVVTGAVPASVNGRRMQAGPAGHGRPTAIMTGGMVIAEPALEPGRVFADPRGRMLGEDDAPGLVQQAFGHGAVGFDTLDM